MYEWLAVILSHLIQPEGRRPTDIWWNIVGGKGQALLGKPAVALDERFLLGPD